MKGKFISLAAASLGGILLLAPAAFAGPVIPGNVAMTDDGLLTQVQLRAGRGGRGVVAGGRVTRGGGAFRGGGGIVRGGGGRRGGRGFGNAIGAGAAIGILGGVLGAIASQPQGPVYVEPGYGGEDAVQYCMRRFRSYNPRTGTYRGYDGRLYACP